MKRSPALALCLLLVLTGCGWLPSPSPPTRTPQPPAPPGTPFPRPARPPAWEAAVAIDARRIAREPDTQAGANVIVRGVAEGVRREGGATLFGLAAIGPNRLTVPLSVELIPPAEVLDGRCVAVYGVVAGGGARPPLIYGYRVAPVVNDETGICPP
jgi:hypothetical protein